MKSGRSQSILTISAVAFVAAFLVDMYLIFAAASNIELIIAVSLIVIVDTYFLVDGILAKVDEVVSINIDKQNELTKVEKGIYSVAKREEISRGQSMSAIIDVVLDMKDENERMTEQLMEQDKLLAKLFIKKDMDNTTKMVNSNERIAVLLAQMAAANAKSQDESIEILNEMQKRLEESKADVDAEYAEFRNEYQKLEDAIKSHRKLEGGYSTPKSDAEADFEGTDRNIDNKVGFGGANNKSDDDMDFGNAARSTDENAGFGEVNQEPSDGMNLEDSVQNTDNGMGFEENNRKPNDKMAFSEADKKSDGGMNVKENYQTPDEDIDFEIDTWEDDNTNFEERYREPDEVVPDGNYREIDDDDIRLDSYRGTEESYRELDDDNIWFEDEYPKSEEAGIAKNYRQSDNLDNDYGRFEEAATEDIKADKDYRRFDNTMFEKVYPNANGTRMDGAYRDDDIGNERRYFKADYNDSEFDGIYQRLDDDDMEFDGIYRRLDDDTAFDGIYQRLGDEDTELDDIYRKLNEGHTELNDIYQKSREDNKEQGVAQYPHLRMMEL